MAQGCQNLSTTPLSTHRRLPERFMAPKARIITEMLQQTQQEELHETQQEPKQEAIRQAQQEAQLKAMLEAMQPGEQPVHKVRKTRLAGHRNFILTLYAKKYSTGRIAELLKEEYGLKRTRVSVWRFIKSEVEQWGNLSLEDS